MKIVLAILVLILVGCNSQNAMISNTSDVKFASTEFKSDTTQRMTFVCSKEHKSIFLAFNDEGGGLAERILVSFGEKTLFGVQTGGTNFLKSKAGIVSVNTKEAERVVILMQRKGVMTMVDSFKEYATFDLSGGGEAVAKTLKACGLANDF